MPSMQGDNEINLTAPGSFVDVGFWEDSSEWPRHDPFGYVFLARAFVEVGRALFGNDWTKIVTEAPEPKLPAAGHSDKAAWDQFERQEEQYDDELKAAEDELEQKWIKIARTIAENCEKGTMIAAVRKKCGGVMVQLDTSFWNTENYGAHFFCCDASVVAPFSAPRHKKDHWIYITRESLDRTLESNATIHSTHQQKETDTSAGAALPKYQTKRQKGRPRGAGSWAQADEPHIQEMHRLISTGLAASPNSAAAQIARQAKGSGTIESKQARLRKLYRKRFPSSDQ